MPPRHGGAKLAAAVHSMIMTPRRYGDDEVREIFSLATTSGARDRSLAAEPGGLTLDELQRIGEEAGIDPSRIAQAAARLDAQGKAAPLRRAFGMPIGLSRVIELPRAPTDREWEQLIAEFRTTFGAPGEATTSGGLRQWSLGDLHISVEPTARGQQLRLSSTNSAGMLLNGMWILFGGLSAIMATVVAAAGRPEKAVVVLGMFGGIAVTALLANVLRSPGWARERARQLEEVAEHAVRLLSPPSQER